MSPFDVEAKTDNGGGCTIRRRPSREDAEDAVRTLISWAGEDPEREGLVDTPRRVVRAYEEYFAGYGQDKGTILARTFSETNGYDAPIVLTDIRFISHCEHHMAPIVGRAHISYLPANRVVGISKLARVVEQFARRLQIQERMTAQIADAVMEALCPKGCAVIIEGMHYCMMARGVRSPQATMVTRAMRGVFEVDQDLRASFERIATRRQQYPAENFS